MLSKRVISFEDPIEPIIINNCHYYSGIVDNSTKLRVFYEASVIPTTDEPIIDYIGSNVGLLLRHKSYYLSNVDSCPDIGLSEQLHCSIDPNETIVEILGFKLIKSKDTLQSFEKFEIVSDSEIIFSEIDGDHKIYLGT
ncbi:MAG: hypothetical protein MJ233_01000 [Mycoplasmoidaceae bacterium]|nr:hypothetical protein [Mycoplasmoidaceae bacterium]